MAKTKITITHDKEKAIDVQNKLLVNAFTSKSHANQLGIIVDEIANGVRNGAIVTIIDDGNEVASTGILTYSSVATAGDTILVNGVTLTAVASGAVSGQFNVGASASLQAANTAAGINLSAALIGVVTAAAVGAVVTVSAAVAGTIGNAVTLAKGIDAGSTLVVSGVTSGKLQGGLAATTSSAVTYKFGV